MTQNRRPPAPHPAERARTIAARGGRAALLPSDGTEDRVVPVLHHVHARGEATVLLPDGHPLVAAARGAEVTAMLEVADHAPVALREPVRGLLWITGWLRALEPREAREAAVEVAEHRPDPRLLDVGHGTSVLRLVPASLVVADAEGTSSLRPEHFAQADPDPFCAHEDHWLRHLELSHRDVVGLLSQHLPEELRGGHVRPLGLDRFGLRLRVEAADADHDVRISFSRPVRTAQELSVELRRLMGCPFLARRG
ncbi:DUF2470 domain-containing protein [Saccharothrix coeruleofusca]|uniref:DUF2470 domain-containing protein n=1 Tax=Saccharothrix coeruleofusca TaxID=33919 RepID=A0A918AJM7_9PSEU|nr:DUF2470 domain-containing protein [Saccharothrix coeruleofusca]GGP37466.1 hypothetical protein GCM10010185_06040 [Saccharothrix coeruleofusca]